MIPLKLYKDGEPYTVVLVHPDMADCLLFSVVVDGAVVELTARPIDPRKAGSPAH